MEEEIIRRAQVRGIKADLFQVNLTEEENFAFAQKAYAIVKDFASLNPTTNPNIGIIDYTVNNIERLFKAKGKSAEAEFSKFVSLFASHRQAGEIDLYRQLFSFNINIKSAQLFIKYFLDVLAINQHLYSNKSRLLQHVKLDTLKAKELANSLLRKDLPISVFNNLVLKYLEEHAQEVHKIHADVAGRFLIQAYYLNNQKKEGEENNQDLLLNWNSNDPNVFEIKVKKQEHVANAATEGAQTAANMHNTNGSNDGAQALEQINADFHKKAKDQSAKVGQTQDSKSPTFDTQNSKSAHSAIDHNKHSERINLPKICHDYVLGKNNNDSKSKRPKPTDEYSEAADSRLNKDLERLRKELALRKNEMEVEKSVWRLVLNNSKTAIKNYGELKKEIAIAEGLAETLLNVVDKNSPDWKTLYDIKNNDVNNLYKYKFLIAALLEHCLQDLDKDIEGFKFGHDEPTQKMNRLLGKQGNFDLNDYLTNVFQTNKAFASSEGSNVFVKPGDSPKRWNTPSKEDLEEPVIQQFRFPGKPAVKEDSLESAKKGDAKAEVKIEEVQKSPEELAAEKEKEEQEIKEAMENQELSKLKKHLLKLKRELVFAPKKSPKAPEDEVHEEQLEEAVNPNDKSNNLNPTQNRKGKDGVKGKGGKDESAKSPMKGNSYKVDPKTGQRKPVPGKF